MDERHTLTRRTFLEIAGALPFALAASRALPAWAVARIPVALQLYSVRGDCKQNFDAALEQVAAMGFDGVEFAGYYNYATNAAGLAAKLKALNLKAAGTHVRMDALRGDALKSTIDFHQAIGCRFLVVPGDPAFTDPEKSKALADELNAVAATLKPLGMATGYHNHVNEFKNRRRQDVLGSLRRADDEGRHPAAGLRVDDGGRTRSGGVHPQVPRPDEDHALQADRPRGRHRQEGHLRPGFGGLEVGLRGVPVRRRDRVDRAGAGTVPRRQVPDGLHAGVVRGCEGAAEVGSREADMVDLEALKKKYGSVIDYGKTRGVSWKNVHVEKDKLLIRGAAPNDAIKNEMWIKIKDIDPMFQDLTADITIDASLKAPETTYTVAAGDSLSKIAKQFYGDANKYMKIFDANKDQLKNPDLIKPGQVLRIPD